MGLRRFRKGLAVVARRIVKTKKEPLRGAAYELVASREHEVIICGPSDTGKTWPCCMKAHILCMTYPGCQGAIVRKTAASLAGSVLKTFTKVTHGNGGVEAFGGETPSRFIYPNGSTIWCGGMDNADRILSSERDFIYTCQTEELTLNDWEYMATRCSGRGAVVKCPQLYGDANPGGSQHWIRKREKEGKLRLLSSKHTDNPTLYRNLTPEQAFKEFPDGNPPGAMVRDGATYILTDDGRRRLKVLDDLTGMRRKRLFEGAWASAEGAVYDGFSAAVHVLVREVGDMKRWFLACDEGYTNPAVILDVGIDSDGRQHVFREWYERGKLQNVVVDQARQWFTWEGRRHEFAAVDEAAAGLIADMNSMQVYARGAKGRVIDGINKIQNLLKVQGDGRPRLTMDPSCVNLINEFESYCWEPDKPKDQPKKENDHALDALRYLSVALGVSSGFSSASVFGGGVGAAVAAKASQFGGGSLGTL